jgi:hypothetical protein
MNGLIIRDGEEVRPLRLIRKTQVCELNRRFWSLKFLCGREQLEEVFNIGFHLRCWHDLFLSEISWRIWRDCHLRIPEDAIPWLMRMWDNAEVIRRKSRPPVISFRSRDGTLTPPLPTRSVAVPQPILASVQQKNGDTRPRKRRRPSRQVCSVCGCSFVSVRRDATICSAKCRKRVSRQTARQLDLLLGTAVTDIPGAKEGLAGRLYLSDQNQPLSVTSGALKGVPHEHQHSG